jgi:hypothetical protein
MIALALRRQRSAFATLAAVLVLCVIGVVAPFVSELSTYGPSQLLVALGPLLIGLIPGTTLFSRELDRGEHVFTLTQGTHRTAWWASTLGAGAIAAALAAGLLSLVNTPLVSRWTSTALYPPWFESTGIAVIAYAVLVFSIAATVGLLTRSTLAAVVIALIAYFAILFVLSGLRVGYLPAESVTTPVIGVTSNDIDVPAGSRTVSFEYLDDTGRAVPIDDPRWERACVDVWDNTCLTKAGVVGTLIRYQPPSRYWPFQLIESGILLALSALVVAAGRIELRRATRP